MHLRVERKRNADKNMIPNNPRSHGIQERRDKVLINGTWEKNQHWSNCLPVKYEGFVGLPNRDSALVVAVVIGMGYDIIENKNISTVGTGSEHDE